MAVAEALRREMTFPTKKAPVGEHLALFAMDGEKKQQLPSANLGLFSLKLPIITVDVTNVLLGESLINQKPRKCRYTKQSACRKSLASLYSIF